MKKTDDQGWRSQCFSILQSAQLLHQQVLLQIRFVDKGDGIGKSPPTAIAFAPRINNGGLFPTRGGSNSAIRNLVNVRLFGFMPDLLFWWWSTLLTIVRWTNSFSKSFVSHLVAATLPFDGCLRQFSLVSNWWVLRRYLFLLLFKIQSHTLKHQLEMTHSDGFPWKTTSLRIGLPGVVVFGLKIVSTNRGRGNLGWLYIQWYFALSKTP